MSTAISHFTRSPENAGVVAVLPGKLSVGEKTSFASCEETIRKGLKTFYEVGHALARIRDEQLYRAEFGTFREYCAQRWQMSDRHARHMIDSSAAVRSVIEQLGPGTALPATESQARPLATLPEAKRGEAWEEAFKSAPAGKVTAKHVQAAVDKRKPAPEPKSTAEAPRRGEWPKPNEDGIYPLQHAIKFTFSGDLADAGLAVLQVSQSYWVWDACWHFRTGSMVSKNFVLRDGTAMDYANTREEAVMLAAGKLKSLCLAMLNNRGKTVGKAQKQMARKMIDWAHGFLPAEKKPQAKAPAKPKSVPASGPSILGGFRDSIRKRISGRAERVLKAIDELAEVLVASAPFQGHCRYARHEIELLKKQFGGNP